MIVALLLWAGLAGKDWGTEANSYRDPVTGLEVRQLTAKTTATNLYYHFSNFTADNSNIILAAETQAGWQIFRSEAASGRLVQLTGEPGVAAAAATPHPTQANLVYFLRGADLIELDIFSLKRRTVGAIPQPYAGGGGQPTFSHDLRSLTVSKKRDASTWEIGLIDLASGAYRTVLTQGFQIGHVQHSPADPLIFYAWETGGYAPQRSWLVHADGSGNRPFYVRAAPKDWWTPLKEWLTHESWIAKTGQMTMIMDKIGIVLVEKDGSSRLLVHGNYWHCAASPDGRQLVADDFDGRIWLIEAATGNTRLLATGARGKARKTHAHPSFDRQGRWVLFNNARNHGTVSIVEVPR